MFILHLLPDWFFFVLAFLGAATFAITYFLKYIPIPALYMYRATIQAVSVLVIFVSMFLAGVVYSDNTWTEKAKELELKIKEAEERSRDTNVVVEQKIVEKTKIVKEKGQDIIKYVDRDVVKKEEIIKYVENCPIPKEIVEIHNKAAGMDK